MRSHARLNLLKLLSMTRALAFKRHSLNALTDSKQPVATTNILLLSMFSNS